MASNRELVGYCIWGYPGILRINLVSGPGGRSNLALGTIWDGDIKDGPVGYEIPSESNAENHMPNWQDWPLANNLAWLGQTGPVGPAWLALLAPRGSLGDPRGIPGIPQGNLPGESLR